MTDRRPAWGAVPTRPGHWHLRLWAPGADSLSLRLGAADRPMEAEGDGWFGLEVEAEEGAPYSFVLPDGMAVPDPAARRQQGDVHGPSLLTAPPADDPWAGWSGRPWEEAAILELHVGTFTGEGTFRAAIDRLDHIAKAGFTAIEIMPVAQFAGDRGWGYDGVLLYAPHPAYGTPDDLRALVRAAHERGLMVLLDVVYNHFGPEGSYLHAYAPDFFHDEKDTPWGGAIAFERQPVRRFMIENGLYWLREFGFDGLRLDAIDHIDDPSDEEVLIEFARELRAALPGRPVHLTTEDSRNVTHLHEREDGRVTLHTAEWNDDFHNVAHVIATGETEAYYADFAQKEWAHLARTLAEGFAYQGEPDRSGKVRGKTSGHQPPTAFVDFLQNHDQIGNRAFGERLCNLASPRMVDALTAILLLSPHIPLMFMGEEYGETRSFCFFAGFDGDLARAVTEGRRREFADFSAFTVADTSSIPDPIARSTFEASKLDWAKLSDDDHRATLDRTRHLLTLRRERIVPLLAGAGPHCGTVLKADEGAIAVDWRLGGGALLQLRANLEDQPRDLPPATGEELHRVGAPGGPISAVHWLGT
ncbi:malto-oligosyltrehalose trehalohydrolase [Wenxinia marina]|uniref:Malto-oligosyltrehalose trehalohydrolase n=1 Tax=Wenxinia marina DSM 24838 TaxID=1123501 RepID=A0A0D0Q6F3_9RHOB|nr:malto-oligosyltrehalose trehalohydrolase [Wenxinia marina]KIQ70039.1 maltooligosyl trehalose hydrolase [Wenxinia marina DSM 24838]GGL63047.1 malto-oligosyltrehalose trehalohydrolase [Wenxinia marina]